jgi:benzoyl-CoA reductase/2-hydroxyglutaryl-CoA dehydratase subunit BcrC/BadD/HgdB
MLILPRYAEYNPPMLNIPRRIETIKKFKENGGRAAAVLPIHYSRELLRAFNILPVEVWGPPQVAAGKGASHLQAYVCSICHNAMSYIQQGGLDITDVILVPHACDSLQGVGSVLLDFVATKQPVIPLYIPRDTRESDIEFLSAELRAVYNRLSEITGLHPSDVELSASIEREEAADQLLINIHLQNPYLPFSNAEIYKIIRCREYLPAEEFMKIAQSALNQVASAPRKGTPILLEGIVPEPVDLLETLSELDAAVVGDDMASCGRRLYPRGASADPFTRMAERIVHAPPDPMRGSPIRARRDHLLEMAARTQSKGIIFYVVKFCEPELFDLPILRQELKDAGLPSILIETDLNTRLSQQIRTRLGAFMEILQ